jgi:hypothetical protein
MKALLESLERGSNDWALAQSLGPQRLPERIAMRCARSLPTRQPASFSNAVMTW